MQFNKNPCSWAENGASLGLRSEQTQPLSSRSSGPQGHLRCGALGCKSQELTQAKWSDQGNLWKTSGMCRRTQGHLGQGRDWKPELKQGHDPGHYSNPTSDLHIAALLILSISSPFLLILCAHAGNKWPPPPLWHPRLCPLGSRPLWPELAGWLFIPIPNSPKKRSDFFQPRSDVLSDRTSYACGAGLCR